MSLARAAAPLLLGGLLAAACGPDAAEPPARFQDCGDPACRRAWVTRQLALDPAMVVAPLVALEDPVEQLALVELVAEARPGSNQALCDALAPGPARQRCETLNARVHLVDRQPDHREDPARRAPGPGSWRLDTSGLPASRLLGRAIQDDPCPQDPDPRRCYARASRGPAALGDSEAAAAYCQAITEEQWRDECHFQASEVVLRNRRDREAMADAVDLCLLAGRFADNCFGHIALRLSEDVVPVDAATVADWQALATRAAELEAVLLDRGMAAQAPMMGELFWAESLGVAYLASEHGSGLALDHLPAQARPHVHAAAAARLVRRQVSAAVPSLAGMSLALKEDLARRDAPTGRRREGGRGWRPRDDLWPVDRPEDLDIPAVVYLGASRRALALDDAALDDPDADLRICLLEAWARLHPDQDGPLLEGAQDPHPLVSWTARRLMAQPRGPDPGRAGEAPTPRRRPPVDGGSDEDPVRR